MKRVLKTIRKFIITDLNKNEVSFDNVYDVAEYLGVSFPTIYNAAKNKKLVKSESMLYNVEYIKEYK